MAARDKEASCVVETDGLSSIVRGFIDSWSRTRPNMTARREVAPITALDWLVQETRLPKATIENIAREQPRFPTTDLRIADALVTAIDQPYAFHDGTLTVRSRGRIRGGASDVRCCGGSLDALALDGAAYRRR